MTQKRRGRGPKVEPAGADGVAQLTAHRPLTLLEVQEKSDLDALMASPKLSVHILARLDDHFALVQPDAQERLLTALRKAGHTPRVSEGT
ncbi:hypothetical protein [Deinococcus sonorensis]|uniref:Uncharacterized protein n=2 Tax=Deinococcus sonorensis TaxID=309891 RepID=A0AAU7UE72_9DEIO